MNLFPTQMRREEPQQVSEAVRTFLMVLAIIFTIVSGFLILLDVSSIFFFINSGQIVWAIVFLLVGVIKHTCQVWWFLILFSTDPPVGGKMIAFGICGVAFGVIAICFGVHFYMLYKETQNFIEVLMHPYIYEFALFLITDGVALLACSQLADPKYAPQYYYAPIQQPQILRQPQYPQISMFELENMQKNYVQPYYYSNEA